MTSSCHGCTEIPPRGVLTVHLRPRNPPHPRFNFSPDNFTPLTTSPLRSSHPLQNFGGKVVTGVNLLGVKFQETVFLKLNFLCRWCGNNWVDILFRCQVSVWQSATLLPISCKSVHPVPSRVEEPVSPVSGGAPNNSPFPNMQ